MSKTNYVGIYVSNSNYNCIFKQYQQWDTCKASLITFLTQPKHWKVQLWSSVSVVQPNSIYFFFCHPYLLNLPMNRCSKIELDIEELTKRNLSSFANDYFNSTTQKEIILNCAPFRTAEIYIQKPLICGHSV